MSDTTVNPASGAIEAARRLPEGASWSAPFRNIAALIDHQSAARPTATWLSFHDDDLSLHRTWTYADMRVAVQTTAGLLNSLGVVRGDRVAFLIGNLDHTVVLYLAAWSLGACVAPINSSEPTERKAFILENSGARVLFARTDYLDEARELAATSGARLIAVAARPEDAAGVDDLPVYPGAERRVTSLSLAGATFEARGTEALLIYTSGTTGPPKGVRIDQTNLMADAWGMATWHGWGDDLCAMCVLPIHHVNGIVVTHVTPLFVGGRTVLNARFNTRTFWGRVRDEGVHVVSVVPTLLEFLIDADRRGLGSPGFAEACPLVLRTVLCGAGPLLVETALAFEQAFGVPLTHGYGLSETTCYNCHMPPDLTTEQRLGWYRDHGFPSIGVPLPLQEMAILGPDGAPVPDGERGEICIRGACVSLGYHQRPDANEQAFRDGWFRSGDEGFALQDERGRPFFFITGRIKELIIRGGVNYSPLEIDEVLNAHPAVRYGLAVPFANRYYGDEVAAYVVPTDGAAPTEDELLAWCRERLDFGKCPKVIVFGDEVPYTTTGKPMRIELARRLAETLSAHRDTQFRR